MHLLSKLIKKHDKTKYFKEDQCRVKTKNGAVHLSIIRKFAMELLKKQTIMLSLKRRRKKCIRKH